MTASDPKVSIGLPVYNGEQYLSERLDTLLAQAYDDFELVVSDNASTDRTAEICQERAARDPRLKYHRNKENIGGFPNHDLVFNLSKGKYFMWAGVDDYHLPDYVPRCVELLESRPELVICYTETRYIDEKSLEIPTKERLLNVGADSPAVRFQDLMRLDHMIEPILGLIRSDILRRTRLMPTYPDSDRVLLAELGLYGPFYRIPEPLFSRRSHRESSIFRFPGRHERMRWIDPRNPRTIVFPYNRQAIEFFYSIMRPPLSVGQRLACCRHLAGWCLANSSLIASDYEIAAKDLLRPVLKPILNKIRARQSRKMQD